MLSSVVRLVIFLLPLLLPLPVPTLSAHATAMCVQLGQANANALGHYEYADPHRHGPWTIGTKKFAIKVDFLDYSVHKFTLFSGSKCPYAYSGPALQKNPFINWCPENLVSIKIYAVHQCINNHCELLQGWLKFEVTLTNAAENILAAYIQIRDEHFNAIGTIVPVSEASCPSNTPGAAYPSEFQVLPCSAMGHREPKNSHAIFMADQSYYSKTYSGMKGSLKDYLHRTGDLKKGVQFLWRLDEYWCNRHARFRPEVIIYSSETATQKKKNKKPQVYRKVGDFWLRPKYYGASDIKLPKTTLKCDLEVHLDTPSGTFLRDVHLYPWIHPYALLSELGNDYVNSRNIFVDKRSKRETVKVCQADVRRMYPVPDNDFKLAEINTDESVATFAGRCLKSDTKVPNHLTRHDCAVTETDPEFREIPVTANHSDFLADLKANKVSLCGISCRAPETEEDLKEIKKRTGSSRKLNISGLPELRLIIKKLELYSGRVYHAIAAVIWIMFILPVGLFVARYYKETFMNLEPGGLHLWYYVHLGGTFVGISLFVSSISSLWQFQEDWGRSTSIPGLVHIVVGYFLPGIFIGLAGTGSLSHNLIKVRKVLISGHSVLGFTVYFGSLGAMVASGFIPGSPLASVCDDKGKVLKFAPAFYLIFIWTALDVVAHFAMTIFLLRKDRLMGISRSWLCPIVPILPANSVSDLEGSFERKMIFYAYIAVSFLITTVTTIMLIVIPPSEDCQLGGHLYAGCKQSVGCSGAAKKYLEHMRTAAKP